MSCIQGNFPKNEWFPSNTGFRDTHGYMHGTGVNMKNFIRHIILTLK